jgi:hypothetical protein
MPTRDELIPCLRQMCTVMGSMNCFRVYEIELLPHLRDAGFSEGFIGAMNNALMEATLLNLRCLNEFFFSTTGKGSYIRASNFGVAEMTCFLTKEELNRVNKGLAHMTLERSILFGKWDLYGMVKRGLRHGADFLNRVKTDEQWEIDSETTTQIEMALKVAGGFVRDIENLEEEVQA